MTTVGDNDDGLDEAIYQDEEFAVTLEEVALFWRWLIFRDGEMVQEGVSITERSARDASLKVVDYLRGRSAPGPAPAP